MPGEDGLTLASKLKDLYEIDIVMVTAFQSFEYAQTAIRVGVEDFITKPIIEKDFVTLLDKFKTSKSNCSTIQDVIHIIRENYHQELTLNQIAEQVFLNPSYLSRKFHEETGMKFSEYLNIYRLEMAARLLKENNNNYNIAIIAEKCGFNSQHYFSTMFRRKYGISPRNFAKNIS